MKYFVLLTELEDPILVSGNTIEEASISEEAHTFKWASSHYDNVDNWKNWLDEKSEYRRVIELDSNFELYNIGLLGMSKSHTAEYIYNWCKYVISFWKKYRDILPQNKYTIGFLHRDDIEVAEEILEVFKKDSKFKPNPKNYYVVRYSNHHDKYVLTRDEQKSPRKERSA